LIIKVIEFEYETSEKFRQDTTEKYFYSVKAKKSTFEKANAEKSVRLPYENTT
jgi:hypothetical protein